MDRRGKIDMHSKEITVKGSNRMPASSLLGTLAVSLILVTTGCAMNETEQRAGAGAAIGALGGALLGTSRESAAIGAAIGAAGGFIYDQHEKQQSAQSENERLREENERLRLEAENQRLKQQTGQQ